MLNYLRPARASPNRILVYLPMSEIVQALDYANGLDLANTFTQDYELDDLTVNDGLTAVIKRAHGRGDDINLTAITDAVGLR